MTDPERSLLTMRQTNLPFPEYRTSMDPMWDTILAGLKTFLESETLAHRDSTRA